MGWGRVENVRGDPWYGRPARCVRRRTIIGSPPFTYLPCCRLTSKIHYHSFDNTYRQQSTVSITYGVDCHVVVEPRCWTPTSLTSHGVNCHTITVPQTLAAQPLHPGSHLYNLSNLASLHDSVNRHLHCTCEVYWSFVTGTYSFRTHMHLYTRRTRRTLTPTRGNPYPCWRVRVCPGKGTGSPGIPQGYPWQSLFSGQITTGFCWWSHCDPQHWERFLDWEPVLQVEFPGLTGKSKQFARVFSVYPGVNREKLPVKCLPFPVMVGGI